jgi:hypothetical protein
MRMKKVTRLFVSAALLCRQKRLARKMIRRIQIRRKALECAGRRGDGFEWLVELGEEALERGDVVGASGYFEWVLDRKPHCARSRRGMEQAARVAA